jgi:NTE family protein
MADQSGILDAAMLLRSTALFRELSNAELDELWAHAKLDRLQRGEILVHQDAPSDRVYVVVSGRFEVFVDGKKDAINEIGVGEPIGEVGFFSDAPRTASIVAARDSVVLGLDHASFEAVAQKVPAIYHKLLRALARRLADISARGAGEPRGTAARTVAVIAGGSTPIPPIFY